MLWGLPPCHVSRQLSPEDGVTIPLSLHDSQASNPEPPMGRPLGARGVTGDQRYKGQVSWRLCGQGRGGSECGPLSTAPLALTYHKKTSDTNRTNTHRGQCEGWQRPCRRPGRTARLSVCAQACQASHQRAPSLSHPRGDGSSTARMEHRLPSHWGSLLQAVTLPGESWGQDPQHLLHVPSRLCPPPPPAFSQRS